MTRLLKGLSAALWPPRALWLHLRVIATCLRGWLLYRRLPFDRFMEAWTPSRSRRRNVPSDRIVDAVDRVLSGLGRRRCFARSLIIYRLLRMQGEELSLHVGVKPSSDHSSLVGHAWLEDANGLCWPYGDDGSSYHVTIRHPPRAN